MRAMDFCLCPVDTYSRRGCRPSSSKERVAEFEGAVVRSVMHVLGVEDSCAGTDGGLDDQGVPITDVALLDALEGELDEGDVHWKDVASSESPDDAGDLIESQRRFFLSHRNGDELAEYLNTQDNCL